jgi:hypothetical protein
MSPQLRLPGLDPPKQIRPEAGRKTPAFWVKRIRVVRELKPAADAIVRDVPLRLGLNVVWAPAHLTEVNGLFKDGVSGHTAGKTMFCRLIRHVLGERGLLAEATRKRLRAALTDGWVLGEVVLRDELWTVARPFAIGAHPFCIEGQSIESATDGSPRQPYQAFLDALEVAVKTGLSASQFPANDSPILWQHILPWLSRDQECRYADFLEWRHSSSNSEAPALDVEERQFVMRAVLGLISDEERAEQQNNARLIEAKSRLSARAPLLQHQADVDHGRVTRSLEIDLAAPSSPLFGSEARDELAKRNADLKFHEAELVATDRRAEFQAALQDAVARATHAERDHGTLADALEREKAYLSELAGDSQTALLEGLPPTREYCAVRLSVAREHGCPLAVDGPIALDGRRGERAAAEELTNQRALVARLKSAVATEHGKLLEAQKAVREANATLMRAATTFEETRGRIIQARAQLTQVERLIANAEEAAADAAAQTDRLREIDREIGESYSKQKQIRETQHEAVDRFSASFDYVVRAILGDEITARTEMSGRSLSLVVEEHGERDSAAIQTVKLLAFDLAALVSGIEGRGSFPRFLIHDGPREADISENVYDRLFIFARELEKCFDGEPSFQYIVTTTTPPPADCASEPILRLKLSGAPATERLLKCDL